MATQKEVSEFLGISDRYFRELKSKGIVPTPTTKGGYDIQVCTQAFISYLRRNAKSRSITGSEQEEESQEERKAKLSNDEKEINISLKKIRLYQETKKWAPVELLIYALQQFSAITKTEIETWVPKIRRAYPDIPLSGLKVIEKTGVKINNELSNIDVPLENYVKGSQEFDQDWAKPIEIEDANNG